MAGKGKSETLFKRYVAENMFFSREMPGRARVEMSLEEMFFDASNSASESLQCVIEEFRADALVAGYEVTEQDVVVYYRQHGPRKRQHLPLEEIDWNEDQLLIEVDTELYRNLSGVWSEISRNDALRVFGRGNVDNCPFFERKSMIPGHGAAHRQYQGKVFNLYPRIESGKRGAPAPVGIYRMIRHIFGSSKEEFRSGLEYLRMLWQEPYHKLPVLCLVSKEQGTGKSSFGEVFMQKLFSPDVCGVFYQQHLESKFNVYGEYLVACFEEVKTTNEVVETIKATSTATSIAIERKGKDPIQAKSFCHLILLTNNADRLARVDDSDTRYWIRELTSLNHPDNFDHDAYWREIDSEIPAFREVLSRLKPWGNRQWIDGGRTWFAPRKLRTEAWERNKDMAVASITIDVQAALDNMAMGEPVLFTWSELIRNMPTRVHPSSSIKAELTRMGIEQKKRRGVTWGNREIWDGQKKGKPTSQMMYSYEPDLDRSEILIFGEEEVPF